MSGLRRSGQSALFVQSGQEGSKRHDCAPPAWSRQGATRCDQRAIGGDTLPTMDEPELRSDAAGFPPVLTTAMAAELLQVHVEYLRRMVREGRIPCHRFPGGREMRFLRDE